MLIEFENVMVRLDGRVILSNLNLTLSEGRIGIIGSNGSGKSSLARLVNGLVQPCAGAVRVNGLCARENSRALRRQVGFVFQNPENQLVLPIVGEDLLWGLDAKVFSVDQRQQKVAVALANLGISDLLERSVHTLSGGEKQLVALAGVLVLEPELIIFDEPTTQLDLRMRNRLVEIITQLPQQAIVVSHDLSLIERMDRVLVIDHGSVAFDGPPHEAVTWYRRHCA
jgi:biotin transport system ATP-binding protein